MSEILSYTFIQHALIAGILVSISAGIVGSLVVVNRLVFLSGGIAHAAYGGIGLAAFFSLPMLPTTLAFATLAALIIAQLTYRSREKSDLFIGVIWSVGMATGIILIDLTPGYHADLMSYLFGSILAVERSDLYLMTALLAVTIAVVIGRYRRILAVSYDSEYAQLMGINVRLYYNAILLLSALTVVIAIKIVGLIMVIALLTIPVYLAEKLSASLSRMMVVASLFAMLFTLGGLALSYRYDLTSGASIILFASAVFILFSIALHLRARLR